MEENKKPEKVITEFELPPVESEETLAAQNKRLVGSPAWRAGQSGNPNGRKKGSKNKISGEAKAFIQSLGFKFIKRIAEDMELLTPMQRATIGTKFLPYLSPTMSKLEIDSKSEEIKTITIRWTEPNETLDITHQEEETHDDYECEED